MCVYVRDLSSTRLHARHDPNVGLRFDLTRDLQALVSLRRTTQRYQTQPPSEAIQLCQRSASDSPPAATPA